MKYLKTYETFVPKRTAERAGGRLKMYKSLCEKAIEIQNTFRNINRDKEQMQSVADFLGTHIPSNSPNKADILLEGYETLIEFFGECSAYVMDINQKGDMYYDPIYSILLYKGDLLLCQFDAVSFVSTSQTFLATISTVDRMFQYPYNKTFTMKFIRRMVDKDLTAANPIGYDEEQRMVKMKQEGVFLLASEALKNLT